MGAGLAYDWTEDMGEVTGFGGAYELAARAMVRAGLEWWDRHPKADPCFKSFRDEHGLVDCNNPDAQALLEVMVKAAFGGHTGVMVSACLGVVFWVRRNGWEAYADELRAKKARMSSARGGWDA